MPTNSTIIYVSPLGPLRLSFSGERLAGLQFGSERKTKFPKVSLPGMKRITHWLDDYFQGKNPLLLPFSTFDFGSATNFQKQVWKTLSKIPYGKVVSYQDIAKSIANPKACRAVGNANGRNPIPILIPCHRVIAADGTLGGYSCGLNRKKKLLALEGITL